MYSYYKTQIFNELKSIKTVIISLIFFGLSYAVIRYSNNIETILDDNLTIINLLYGLFAFLIFLFSSILFSGIFSREIENQTLRYVTPYLSRRQIYFAKFLTMMTYFILISTISIILVILFGQVRTLPIMDTIAFLLFLTYIQAFILLISILASNERFASLIGLIVSLAAPALFVLSTMLNNNILKALNWLLPYRYIDLEKTWELLAIIIINATLILLGNICFQKKEI